MIIIMLGAPASGKGSVAEVLSGKLGIPTISSGEIFRKYIKEGSEIGKKVNEYMTKGELVPDDVTVQMISDRLKQDDVKEGAILDGFPRTVNQAKELDKILERDNRKIDIVINLEAPEDEILERVTNRRICTNSDCKAVYNLVLLPSKQEGICDKCGSSLIQRDDDTIEKAKNRLVIYHKETAPVAEYYKDTGILYTTTLSARINRMKEEVSKDVIEFLNKKEISN